MQKRFKQLIVLIYIPNCIELGLAWEWRIISDKTPASARMLSGIAPFTENSIGMGAVCLPIIPTELVNCPGDNSPVPFLPRPKT